ncbi:MAG: T9SS type A sorting domain-containing protein [Bacteroidota bacterium]
MKNLALNTAIIISMVSLLNVNAQCPTATGDEISFGSGSWIGYIYDGANIFDATAYQGSITETEKFDQSFCGSNCNYTTNGCDVNTETFSIRYKMRQNFTCGVYDITIGGDDGVRLSVDGGSTYVINGYVNQPYRTYTQSIFLDGTHDMVLEYYERRGQNRVSFDYTYSGETSFSGVISGDQSFCGNGTHDPSPFTSVQDAGFCGTSFSYQWQSSTNNIDFFDISGATSDTYDPPSGLSQTTYYVRLATDGSTTISSNPITVTVQVPQGDQVSYGSDSWIGYVYDGVNNFTNDYIGYITELEIFNQTFGGNRVSSPTNGCDVYTETFSVQYKMRKTFDAADYTFVVGADDGVRLSIDGGSTYIISDYSDHAYRTNELTIFLDGTYDLVLEYFENGGGNRISFNYSAASTLPVTLVSFDGNFNENQGATKLQWVTATEKDNDYFIVQRSSNGKDYQEIGKVDGSGNSTSLVNYSFVDTDPLGGTNYYRLKQVDFDGQYEYSWIIRIITIAAVNFELYPNPSKGRVRINYYGPKIEKGSLSIYNSNGFLMRTTDLISTIQNKLIDLSTLQKGAYFVEILTGETSIKKRILIVN